MHYEGPRRKGRFIKQGTKVLEQISLVEFSFQELGAAPVVTHDNSKRSIIHSQYHEMQELDTGVTPPDRFNDELIAPELKRPVILPLDFTAEWERTRKMRKDRIARADDDEYDYEFETAQRLAREKERQEEDERNAAAAVAKRVQAAAPTPPAPQTAPQTAPQGSPTIRATASAPNAPKLPGSDRQFEVMDQMGQVLKNLHTPAADGEHEHADPADEFIPVGGTQAGSSPLVRDVEAEAAREYQGRLAALREEEAQLAATAERIKSEARAQGYQDGFRAGEEKAEVSVRQNAGAVFGKVSELIKEFQMLKGEVLDNVQENFYELCQAMAESLLKREFSINPDSFVTVMRRAVAESIAPNKFTIRVNPELFEKVMALGADAAAGIREVLIRDSAVAEGDFKIESEMSIVDVNVTKMIKELLEKADLKLFEEEKSA